MTTLDDLPTEVLLIFAEFCGYGQYGKDALGITQTHRDFASLTLVNRRLHSVFDPILWRYNARHGIYHGNSSLTFPVSAVRWAASRNRIDILEKALRYKHPLGSYLCNHPLDLAASLGQDAACSWLLDHGVPIDCTPCKRIDVGSPFPVLPWPKDHVSPDCSPLHTAISKRQESTAILLLERGAKSWFKTSVINHSAIHLAAQFSLPTAIEYLVKTMGIDVNLFNDRNDTPLFYAVQTRHNSKTIQTLLDLGADIDIEHNFQLALTRAIMLGHFSNAMVLLDAGARVNPTSTHPETLSPLIACTWKSYMFESNGKYEAEQQDEVLRRLIAKGADLNGSFAEETPLCAAVEEGTTSAVFELLKAGADIGKYREEDGMTPFDLVWTIDEPVEELVAKATLLIAAGARLDTPSPYNGHSQLESAIDYCFRMEDSRPLVAILRSATGKNMRDGYLDKLLEHCLLHGELEPARILVYHGATYPKASTHAFSWALQLNQKPDLERKAFPFCLDFLSRDQLKFLFRDAICAKNEMHCQILISRGALSPEDSDPWLHLAASFGSIALVRRLSRSGMDMNALDDKFNTPMMAALKSGKTEVADLLFDLGADPFHPRLDSECRRLPRMSTQILSPFEFAIRENRTVDMRKWWIDSSPESRPTEDYYIPRVLAQGPWLCGFLRTLRYLTNRNLPDYNDDVDMEWMRRCNPQKFDKDAEKPLKLMRALEPMPDEFPVIDY